MGCGRCYYMDRKCRFFFLNSWIINVSYKYYFFNVFKIYNNNNYNYGIMDVIGGCKICIIGV